MYHIIIVMDMDFVNLNYDAHNHTKIITRVHV